MCQKIEPHVTIPSKERELKIQMKIKKSRLKKKTQRPDKKSKEELIKDNDDDDRLIKRMERKLGVRNKGVRKTELRGVRGDKSCRAWADKYIYV